MCFYVFPRKDFSHFLKILKKTNDFSNVCTCVFINFGLSYPFSVDLNYWFKSFDTDQLNPLIRNNLNDKDIIIQRSMLSSTVPWTQCEAVEWSQWERMDFPTKRWATWLPLQGTVLFIFVKSLFKHLICLIL